jgi:prefoldin subunit 5
MEFETLAGYVNEFGLPVVMSIGLGYFVYYVWNYVTETLDPAIEEMHMALIRVIDQTRMLDQDLIRLQQKVNVILQYKENERNKNARKT